MPLSLVRVTSTFPRTEILSCELGDVFPMQPERGFADNLPNEDGDGVQPSFEGQKVTGTVPWILLQLDLHDATNVLQDTSERHHLQPVPSEVQVGQENKTEHIARKRQQEIVVEDQHLQLVELAESSGLNRADVVVVSL